MKTQNILKNTSGCMLLTCGFGLIVTRWATWELTQPADPLLGIRLSVVQWVAAIASLTLGFAQLFRAGLGIWPFAVSWFSGNFWVYMIAQAWSSQRKFPVLLGGIPETFAVSSTMAVGMACFIFAFLTVANGVFLWRQWRWRKSVDSNDAAFVKISCSYCGGHIEFPKAGLGWHIACPHCARTVTLQTA